MAHFHEAHQPHTESFLEKPPPEGFLERAQREREGARLRDEVWEQESEEFIDRLAVSAGARVLEYGSGFGGSDVVRLARRVGPRGEVVAVRSDPLVATELNRQLQEAKVANVRVAMGDLFTINFARGPFDAVYSAWHFAVLPDLKKVLRRLRSLLVPEGRIGVVDLHRDALQMFPPAPALERLLDACRAFYRQEGIDAWVTGRLPEAFVSSGFLFEGAWPRQKAEPPGTPGYRWVESLLLGMGPRLVASHLLADQEWESFLQEWETRRVDPNTLLFCPPVVGVLARTIV